MKQFIKKAIYFLIAGSTLSFMILYISIIYFPEKFIGNTGEYYMWMFQKSKINSTKNKRFNLVIGDSRCMSGINPVRFSNNYINVSLGGATFFEGYLTLKRLIAQENKIDTLILCYGQFHYEYSEVLNARTIPFQFIDYNELMSLNKNEIEKNYSLESKVNGKPSFATLLMRRLKFNRCPVAYQTTFIDNLKYNNITPSIESMLLSLDANNGHALFGNLDSATSGAFKAMLDKFIPNPVLEIYLDSIFHIAKNERLEVFFATPPISQLTYDNCNKNYIKSYDLYLDSICRQNRCTVLNYTTVYSNRFFGDSSHLNKLGSEKFTNEIKSLTSPIINQINLDAN